VCHTIHLCVTHALEPPDDDEQDGIHRVLHKASAIITWFHRSGLGQVEFQYLQQLHPPMKIAQIYEAEDADLPAVEDEEGIVNRPLKLLTAVITRWGSQLRTIERLLEVRRALDAACARCDKPVLTEDEWEQLRQLAVLLKPFAEQTKLFEGEKYPTLSLVWPRVCVLYNHLAVVCGHPLVEAVRLRLRQEMTKVDRFVNPTRAQVFACILDPRFKTLFFIPAEQRDIKFRQFRAFLKETFPEEADVKEEDPDAVAMHELLAAAGARVPAQHAAVVIAAHGANIDAEERAAVAPRAALGKITKEYAAYQKLKRLHVSQDPLAWWKSNEATFPRLAILAKRYLCIPASSAPSERLFSHMNCVVLKRRNRLCPQRIERQTLLRLNQEYCPVHDGIAVAPADGDIVEV